MTIFASFVVALALTIMPLPAWARAYRPEWVPMVLIYWTMASPATVGLGNAWLLGLLMDAAQGALLGQHALGYTLTAYISLVLYQQMRVFPLAQQAIAVGLMLLPHRSLMLWINGILGHTPNTWLYWAPLLSSMLLWPWVFLLLKATRPRASQYI